MQAAVGREDRLAAAEHHGRDDQPQFVDLRGFAGLGEFMRVRREFELRPLSKLPVRSSVIDVSGRDPSAHPEALASALGWDIAADESGTTRPTPVRG